MKGSGRGGARVFRLRVGDESFAVLSFPLMESSLPVCLSDAEREVARLAVAGQSNGEIAAARRTSVRTVANQLASIFRKLGVSSRAELARACYAALDDG